MAKFNRVKLANFKDLYRDKIILRVNLRKALIINRLTLIKKQVICLAINHKFLLVK